MKKICCHPASSASYSQLVSQAGILVSKYHAKTFSILHKHFFTHTRTLISSLSSLWKFDCLTRETYIPFFPHLQIQKKLNRSPLLASHGWWLFVYLSIYSLRLIYFHFLWAILCYVFVCVCVCVWWHPSEFKYFPVQIDCDASTS